MGLIGIPSFIKNRTGIGITTELAIANVVSKPGFTDFALYVCDQNGLMDFVCEKLSEQQAEYINLNTWGFISPGFKGSAVISAIFWEHDVFNPRGGFVRNLVGLAAVTVEPSGSVLGEEIPGDESAGSEGFPVLDAALQFSGPHAPYSPGCRSRRRPVRSVPAGAATTPPNTCDLPLPSCDRVNEVRSSGRLEQAALGEPGACDHTHG